MRSFSKRDRKVLAAGGIGVAVILFVTYVVLPFYEGQELLAGQQEIRTRQIRQYVQAIRQEEVYRLQHEELARAVEEYQQMLLDETDSTTAIGQLEETIRQLADQYEVRVVRSNPLQERKIGEEYAKITLQMNLDADLASLTGFLYAVASQPKYLVVDDFYLGALRGQGQVRIQPRLSISGFIRLS